MRRVPRDLIAQVGLSRVVFSLRTKSQKVAANRSATMASKLESHWFSLRLQDDLNLGRFFRPSSNAKGLAEHPKISVPTKKDETSITLAQALDLYLRLSGANKSPTFHRGATRAFEILSNLCGNKPVTEYNRSDANKLRDFLISKGMAGTSIVRVIANIKAMFNLATSEMGITPNQAFARLHIDRKAGTYERKPMRIEHLRLVQGKCYEFDDEKRWAVALICDTGLRLGEAMGLAKTDFQIRDGVPVVVIQPHFWRRLKTSSSERIIPLVGSALWASNRILANPNQTKFAFPNYNKRSLTNSNSASAILNAWMNSQIPNCGSIHCLRHTFRDRLRLVECPFEIVNELGGWKTKGIGSQYGDGYTMKILHKWMIQIA